MGELVSLSSFRLSVFRSLLFLHSDWRFGMVRCNIDCTASVDWLKIWLISSISQIVTNDLSGVCLTSQLVFVDDLRW